MNTPWVHILMRNVFLFCISDQFVSHDVLAFLQHSDVTISTMASEISSVSIVYSTVCSGAYQREYQSFASLALVRGTRRWPVNSPHKGPVTRKMFPFDDVIILFYSWGLCSEGIRETCILNTHLMKSRLFILSVFVVQSFWKYQCTHCSVQNFKTMASFSDAGAPRGLSRTSADL